MEYYNLPLFTKVMNLSLVQKNMIQFTADPLTSEFTTNLIQFIPDPVIH